MIRRGSETRIARLCKLFGKSRQAYYSKRTYEEIRGMEEAVVLDLVRAIRKDLPKTGVPKLHRMLAPDLAEHGIRMGRDRLNKLLRSHGLMVRIRTRKVRTTWSSHRFRKWSNLAEELVPDRPEQLWVSDITYIRLRDGFAYLSLVTDAYSRKLMGFHLSQTLEARGPIAALRMALQNRRYPGQPLIHHSDRGIQYCCDQYVQMLQNEDIAISMTQSGNPTDNPIAERMNGIFKRELGLNRRFKSYREVLPVILKAVYLYNERRLHSSVDFLTPAEAHRRTGPLKRHWKKARRKDEIIYT